MRLTGTNLSAFGIGAVTALLIAFPAQGQTPAVGTPPAPTEAAAPAPAGMSESVVVTVNDDLISTYDVVQRMRLLIVTSGIQPNDQRTGRRF